MRILLPTLQKEVELRDEMVKRFASYDALKPEIIEDALVEHLHQERSEMVSDEEMEIICNQLMERELIFLELLLPNAISLATHALNRVEDKSFVTKEATDYDVLCLSFDYQKAQQLSVLQHDLEKLVKKYPEYNQFVETVSEIKKRFGLI
ncbi:hypothetical protein SAMN02910358_00470 [Lachnospiraceae bacterium XBB1006]|nr:hypothetical protein SAMN02910358_00470 [Lachnospiraceae bacterium XBB1006]